MEDLLSQKQQWENLIKEKTQRAKVLRDQLNKEEEEINELKEKLKEIDKKILMENSKGKEKIRTENFKEKRKRTEEFAERKEKQKRRRQERFQEELIQEEEIIEKKEEVEEDKLVKFFRKAEKGEKRKNKEIILKWHKFAKEYEQRVKEKIEKERDKIGLELSELNAIQEINDELLEKLGNQYKRETLVKKVMAARKANYIVSELGKNNLGTISMDIIRKTSWDEIKRKVIEVINKRNEENLVIKVIEEEN